jgi:hypothetical protein
LSREGRRAVIAAVRQFAVCASLAVSKSHLPIGVFNTIGFTYFAVNGIIEAVFNTATEE